MFLLSQVSVPSLDVAFTLVNGLFTVYPGTSSVSRCPRDTSISQASLENNYPFWEVLKHEIFNKYQVYEL